MNAEQEIELYDSEVKSVLEVLAHLQRKYGTRRTTWENMTALQNEAMDRFAKLGLIVTVACFDAVGKPKLPPEITIHSRTEEREFDRERLEWEVKKEVAVDDVVKEFLKKGKTEGEIKE